ncbi:MAG: YkvA family protein [Cyanobacteria bacterium J06635_1]
MKKPFNNVVQSWYRKAIKHSKYRWLVVLGTLFYLLSPLDISPDVFPIVGWLDDGAVVALLVTEMSQLMVEQLQSRNKRRATQAANAFQTEDVIISDAIDADVIDVKAVTVG